MNYGNNRRYLSAETTPSTATQTTQYQHDAVGNVVQKTISTDNSNNITTYSYDVNDRLLSENKQGQITSYSYDHQGNTLTETRAGQTKSYVYNSQNQLVKTTLNGQQLQFSYDVDGIRNSKTVNGQVTAYVVDKTQAYAQVIAEFGSNGMTQYTYGDTGLLRQTVSRNSNGSSTSQSHYLLKDALGSTKALADATGTLTDSYAYDAYGEIIASAGSTPNSYKFAGEAFDADLGMYYNRARYYNQRIGRFSQMDSWQGQANNPITLNKYVYANANPVMYMDPSGMFGISEIGVSIFIVNTLTSMRIDNGLNILETNGADVSDARMANYAFGLVNLGGAGYKLFKSFSNTGRAFASKVGTTKNVQDLRGTQFEDYLHTLGGKKSFTAKGSFGAKEFDGAWGDIWYEAKSGEALNRLLSSQKAMGKFQSDIGRGLKVAKDNNAKYVLVSNSPIPDQIKSWLDARGIQFIEML